MEPFGLAHYRQAVHATTELALQTDTGIVLASSVLDALRHRHIILPTLILVAGHNPSQEQQCLTLTKWARSLPISPKIFMTVSSPNPLMRVRSAPAQLASC